MFSFVAAGVSGFRFFRVWGFRVSMLFSVVAQGFCGFGLDLGFLHFNLRVWVGTTKSQDLKDGWMDGTARRVLLPEGFLPVHHLREPLPRQPLRELAWH